MEGVNRCLEHVKIMLSNTWDDAIERKEFGDVTYNTSLVTRFKLRTVWQPMEGLTISTPARNHECYIRAS